MRHRIVLPLAALVAGAVITACDMDRGEHASGGRKGVAPFAEPADDHPTTQAGPRAYVRYVPDRVDDIAWENDLVAFRIYGPELETAAPPMSSGIDAWGKKVSYPIVNTWYKAGEHYYHYDRGEGADVYKTGPSRGTGGIGIWDAAAKKLYVSHDWGTYSILDRGPDKAQFRVTYAPWRISVPAEAVGNAGAPGRKVWQVTTITLPMHSHLNKITTTLYSNEPGDLVVGVGLATHGAADGKLYNQNGRMTWWDKADKAPDDPNDNGYMGGGAIVDPAQLVGTAAIDTDNLLLIKVTPGKPFTYYAGSAWSKGIDNVKTEADWNKYIQEFKADFK